MDARPVGVFDSGRRRPDRAARVPRDDAARGFRLPRRPCAPAVRAAAARTRCAPSRARSASFLEAQDVKLIVVACNTATSAALPQLQEELTVPVIGVITPEAHAAVQATRNRRIGLLATQGTVDVGALRASSCTRSTPASSFHAGRVPAARAADRERRPVRRGDGAGRARVRRAAEGGRRRHGDPRLHALPADPPDLPARLRPRRHARLLGRGDGARGSGDARAKGIENDPARDGAYRFLTTGDPERSGRWAAGSCSFRSERSST